MLDESFCVQLEYAISKALTKSADTGWRRCWCDGVLLPGSAPDDVSTQILQSDSVAMKAWMDEGKATTGQGGQFLYDLKLHLGDTSIHHWKAGSRLEPCIPDTTADHWIILDRQSRMLEVQLL